LKIAHAREGKAMRLLALAVLGGGLGAGARYAVQAAMMRALGAGFPWWTLTINVVGSFLMGAVVALLASRFDNSPDVRTFVATGILGGFTTFSAFSLDFVTLIDRKEQTAAMLYAIGSVSLSILALYAGLALAKALFP
jgi:fluoride exporter